MNIKNNYKKMYAINAIIWNYKEKSNNYKFKLKNRKIKFKNKISKNFIY